MNRKLLIGFCLALVTLFGCKGKLTSDDELVRRFHEHRGSFEELVQVMNDDTNVRAVYKDHVVLDDTPLWRGDDQKGFTGTRWNEYIGRMNSLGSTTIHRISKEGDIIEIASGSIVVDEIPDSEGPLVTSKGYIYSSKEPSPLVESLDNPQMNPCYKRIDGNWYLYYDSGVSKPE
jgi:hypothetical protein